MNLSPMGLQGLELLQQIAASRQLVPLLLAITLPETKGEGFAVKTGESLIRSLLPLAYGQLRSAEDNELYHIYDGYSQGFTRASGLLGATA